MIGPQSLTTDRDEQDGAVLEIANHWPCHPLPRARALVLGGRPSLSQVPKGHRIRSVSFAWEKSAKPAVSNRNQPGSNPEIEKQTEPNQKMKWDFGTLLNPTVPYRPLQNAPGGQGRGTRAFPIRVNSCNSCLGRLRKATEAPRGRDP
jgi:hypothetical protein